MKINKVKQGNNMQPQNSDYPVQDLALFYHANTNLTPATIYDFIESMSVAQSTGHPRHYPALPGTKLDPGKLWKWKFWRSTSLFSALSQRSSTRNFRTSMSLCTLSQIALMSMQAGKIKDSGLRQRPYPSAGGLYGVNVFLLSNNIEGLAQGIYNINADRQCLEQLFLFSSNIDCTDYLESAIVGETAIKQAPAYLFFCGNLNLIKEKYGERSYRFLLLEAGHIAQNIGLVSTVLGRSHVPLGGFCEKIIETKINDKDMIVIYAMAIG